MNLTQNIRAIGRISKRLLRLETEIIGIIAGGVVNSVPKRMVLKEIKAKITEIGLDRAESHHIWLDSVAKYNKISRKSFAELRKSDDRAAVVYNFVRKEIDSVIKTANSVAAEVESRVKRDEISKMLDNNSSPFYVCSAHIDAAKDHKDFEGKMYYDEHWESYIVDTELRKRIRSYIRNRKLRTVQWVCGAPVYMIVRPHCKHYFTRVDIDEALGSSPKVIIKKYHLYNDSEKPLSSAMVRKRKYERRLYVLRHLREVIHGECKV